MLGYGEMIGVLGDSVNSMDPIKSVDPGAFLGRLLSYRLGVEAGLGR